jgi:hypothetical protein
VSERVYVPLDVDGLARLAAGELGPPPLEGYRATGALRRWYDEDSGPDAGSDDEQLEAAAAALAAQASLAGLGPDGSARLVAAVEVDAAVPDELSQPGRVRLDGPVRLRDLAAVLADTAEAAADVRAAVTDPSDAKLDTVDGHALAWWGPGELPDLLEELGAR